jgi:DNA-binding SARP family transcriptional activator
MRLVPDLWTAQSTRASDSTPWPVLICLLGGFQVVKGGRPITLRQANKTQALLACLALERDYTTPRETLLQTVWPDRDVTLAGQSLNSLIHSLRKLLSDQLDGATPVVCVDGSYHLNVEAGIGTDIDWFNSLLIEGERHTRSGDQQTACECYTGALRVYRGDLCTGSDLQCLIEREHLRAQYLTLLARLADHNFAREEYSLCLEYVQRLLSTDPCREDAHRLGMRCYTRRGERAQAMRQFRLCEAILRAEFDVTPEAATLDLYQQIRTNPQLV